MKNKYKVNLNEISKIKEFNKKISELDSEVDLLRGRYVIDAKSLMGIFTLDVSLPIDIVLYSEDPEEIKLFKKIIKEFE